jgi:hypothetical protein
MRVGTPLVADHVEDVSTDHTSDSDELMANSGWTGPTAAGRSSPARTVTEGM